MTCRSNDRWEPGDLQIMPWDAWCWQRVLVGSDDSLIHVHSSSYIEPKDIDRETVLLVVAVLKAFNDLAIMGAHAYAYVITPTSIGWTGIDVDQQC